MTKKTGEQFTGDIGAQAVADFIRSLEDWKPPVIRPYPTYPATGGAIVGKRGAGLDNNPPANPEDRKAE